MEIEDCTNIRVGDRIAIELHGNSVVVGRVKAIDPKTTKFVVSYKASADILFPSLHTVGSNAIMARMPPGSLLTRIGMWLLLR